MILFGSKLLITYRCDGNGTCTFKTYFFVFLLHKKSKKSNMHLLMLKLISIAEEEKEKMKAWFSLYTVYTVNSHWFMSFFNSWTHLPYWILYITWQRCSQFNEITSMCHDPLGHWQSWLLSFVALNKLVCYLS